jgi:Fe-S-cluster containining protein
MSSTLTSSLSTGHLLFQELQALYKALEEEIQPYIPLCQRSSRCCHFKSFGHRLYSTSLEVQYALNSKPLNLPLKETLKPLTCPYLQEDGACGNREGRPLGCRIFFCDPQYEKEIAPLLYEKYHKKIQTSLEKFKIEYFYGEMTLQLQEKLLSSPLKESCSLLSLKGEVR